jgi:hypothetical protein
MQTHLNSSIVTKTQLVSLITIQELVVTSLVTTERLGKARIPKFAFEHPDGSPLVIGADFFNRRRNAANPTAGPFENPGKGELRLN